MTAPSPKLSRKMFALFGEAGIGREQDRPRRLAVCSFITWRHITSSHDLTAADAGIVVTTLEYWNSLGALAYRCQRTSDAILGKATP